ncbi:MAG: 3-deoxy-8-phosphooctulonate synthase [Geminicoccaceae bacterium]|nr:3-deoxy-8-phosphooctulonate synthase [Geminicoccaceae bacterium]
MTTAKHQVTVGSVHFGNDLPLALIAGPCQIESETHAMEMALALDELATGLDLPLVFKASYDKANRTSIGGSRGVGMEKGLRVLADIKAQTRRPVITDIHETTHAAPVAEVCDVLQIPAYLCRQTDLLEAAARTGAAINVKKGQFLAPWDMRNVVKKLESFGSDRILVCERGASFGYNTLVSDMRALPELASTGWPVVFDATHSVQQPGGQGGSSGGQRQFVPVLARAAVSLGISAVFIETHDNPDQALSDGPNMVPLNRMRDVMEDLMAFDKLSKARRLPQLA